MMMVMLVMMIRVSYLKSCMNDIENMILMMKTNMGTMINAMISTMTRAAAGATERSPRATVRQTNNNNNKNNNHYYYH